MKIKDLPKDKNLRGVRFRMPGSKRVYTWYSQWQKGIWVDMGKGVVKPLFLNNLSDCAEFEVVDGKENSVRQVDSGGDEEPEQRLL